MKLRYRSEQARTVRHSLLPTQVLYDKRHMLVNCFFNSFIAFYGVILNAKGADCVFRIIYLVATIRKGD